jgi:hypothetical protein
MNNGFAVAHYTPATAWHPAILQKRRNCEIFAAAHLIRRAGKNWRKPCHNQGCNGLSTCYQAAPNDPASRSLNKVD